MTPKVTHNHPHLPILLVMCQLSISCEVWRFLKIIPHMTSSNGNIFHVTGSFCRELNGHRWIPLTKASDADLWCFFDLRLNKRLSKQSWGWWIETPSQSLWRHCYFNPEILGQYNGFWCIASLCRQQQSWDWLFKTHQSVCFLWEMISNNRHETICSLKHPTYNVSKKYTYISICV